MRPRPLGRSFPFLARSVAGRPRTTEVRPATYGPLVTWCPEPGERWWAFTTLDARYRFVRDHARLGAAYDLSSGRF